MRGRGLAAVLVAGVMFVGGCGSERGGLSVDPAAGDGPITAASTARGLTAGLLGHVDQDHVKSYGGYHRDWHGYEWWAASSELDGGTKAYLFVNKSPHRFDPGCEPDDFYTELSCTSAAGGAKRSLMQRTGGDDRMPLLTGQTTRADGSWVLVELFQDTVTDDAKTLVLELLDDEALGAHTTKGLNQAGAALEDYEELEFEATIEDSAS